MRLLNLTVRNFRGFGSEPTSVSLDGELILFFGPNGFGKTSLAEAIEWLFYGTTVDGGAKARKDGDKSGCGGTARVVLTRAGQSGSS
jgi:DNA repair exonuclease SbcCD ATPase subunit